MNKTECVNQLCVQTVITQKDCKLCLETILQVIKESLKKGQVLPLSNFSTFQINEVKLKPICCFKTKSSKL